MTCDECGKDYPASEVKRVREDDEGGYWNLCATCMDWLADLYDEMEG